MHNHVLDEQPALFVSVVTTRALDTCYSHLERDTLERRDVLLALHTCLCSAQLPASPITLWEQPFSCNTLAIASCSPALHCCEDSELFTRIFVVASFDLNPP
jgi:hypothetical protein